MLEVVDPVTGAVGTAAGLTLLMWVAKVLLKQFSSGVLDVRSDHASGKLIADLVSQNERLTNARNLAEEKAIAMASRRISDRGHALYAKNLVEIFDPLPSERREKVISELEKIVNDP